MDGGQMQWLVTVGKAFLLHPACFDIVLPEFDFMQWASTGATWNLLCDQNFKSCRSNRTSRFEHLNDLWITVHLILPLLYCE